MRKIVFFSIVHPLDAPSGVSPLLRGSRSVDDWCSIDRCRRLWIYLLTLILIFHLIYTYSFNENSIVFRSANRLLVDTPRSFSGVIIDKSISFELMQKRKCTQSKKTSKRISFINKQLCEKTTHLLTKYEFTLGDEAFHFFEGAIRTFFFLFRGCFPRD